MALVAVYTVSYYLRTVRAPYMMSCTLYRLITSKFQQFLHLSNLAPSQHQDVSFLFWKPELTSTQPALF